MFWWHGEDEQQNQDPVVPMSRRRPRWLDRPLDECVWFRVLAYVALGMIFVIIAWLLVVFAG